MSGNKKNKIQGPTFMPTLIGSRCETIQSNKMIQLDLKVNDDELNGGQTMTKSFVLNEEQVASLVDDMDRIRQQLFRSVNA
ncbi:hypothetical protein BLOT_013259 [Blomia tropicalis]|nr:hypothetical protein BLOT_013259 [Blomia tropicalis]